MVLSSRSLSQQLRGGSSEIIFHFPRLGCTLESPGELGLLRLWWPHLTDSNVLNQDYPKTPRGWGFQRDVKAEDPWWIPLLTNESTVLSWPMAG